MKHSELALIFGGVDRRLHCQRDVHVPRGAEQRLDDVSLLRVEKYKAVDENFGVFERGRLRNHFGGELEHILVVGLASFDGCSEVVGEHCQVGNLVGELVFGLEREIAQCLGVD